MEISLELRSQEESIIQAAIRKEKWAQRWIYEEHFGQMMGACLRYSRDEQEAFDLLHDGFIKVFKNLDKYSTGTSLRSWIKRIMVNNCIDHYRKIARKRTDDIDEVLDVLDTTPDVVSQMSEQDILAALQQLTPMYRTVFNMYVIEGFSHREIGEKLGITESTSRSNLVKARTKLKSYINKHLQLRS